MRDQSLMDDDQTPERRTIVLDRKRLLKRIVGALGIALALVLAIRVAANGLQEIQAQDFERHCAQTTADKSCGSTPIGRIQALPRTGAGAREALILVMRPVIHDIQLAIGSPPSQLIAQTETAEACISDVNAQSVRNEIKSFVLSLASSRSRIDTLSAAFEIGAAAKNAKTPLGQFVPDELTWGSQALTASEPLVTNDVASSFLTKVIMSCGD